jgi:hypothetical protein
MDNLIATYFLFYYVCVTRPTTLGHVLCIVCAFCVPSVFLLRPLFVPIVGQSVIYKGWLRPFSGRINVAFVQRRRVIDCSTVETHIAKS